MSNRKRRDAPVSKPAPSAIKEAERFIRDVERMLKKHAKRVKEDDETRLRQGIDDVREAIEAENKKRLAAAVKELDKRADAGLAFAKKSTGREYAESIGVAIFIAVLLRFFVLEAFKIPTGSMIPTLEVGDHIFVNKFIYGLRVPFSNELWFTRWGTPERGHVIVFRYPKDPSKDYIKRVVAVAGDKVRVQGHDVYINGEKLQHAERQTFDLSGIQYTGYREHSHEDTHQYTVQYQHDGNPLRRFPYRDPMLDGLDCPNALDGVPTCTVEPGYVFVMGDNRDNSQDSREWGGVPHRLVKGRAMFIWFSWGPRGIDWGRFGKAVR